MLKNSLRSAVVAGFLTLAGALTGQDVVAQTVDQVRQTLAGAKVYKFGNNPKGDWELLEVYRVTPTGTVLEQSKPHHPKMTQFQYERHAPASYHTTDPIRSDLYEGELSSLELDKNFSPVAPGSAKLISTTSNVPSALKNALTGTPAKPIANNPSKMTHLYYLPEDVTTAIETVLALPKYKKSFLVVSKTNCRAYLIRQTADHIPSVVDDFPVLLGRAKNDEKYGRDNRNTRAGIYVLRRYEAGPERVRNYGGNGHFRILEATSDQNAYNGDVFNLGIHNTYLAYEPGQIPRLRNIADGNPANNKVSNGCINVPGKIAELERELDPSMDEYAIVIVTPEPPQ